MRPINGEPVFVRRKLNAGQPRKVNKQLNKTSHKASQTGS